MHDEHEQMEPAPEFWAWYALAVSVGAGILWAFWLFLGWVTGEG